MPRKLPPGPESIEKAAKVLRRLAAQERNNDDLERAKLLDHAAEICEAKAFVGVIAEQFGGPARRGGKA